MQQPCLLYYITDRTALAEDEPTRRVRLVEKIGEAARAGVDLIQLREKDLSTRELETLARKTLALLNQLKAENRELTTQLLINSRTDLAFAVGAEGVHLRSDDISPTDVRNIWKQCGAGMCGAGTLAREPVIGVSCHSPEEVHKAATAGANFAVFAPVFEKKGSSGTKASGLSLLKEACRASIPVLALGGINLKNAESCLEAGAAGIAAIRLFQENDVASIVRHLRG